ncbi:ATP synthase F0 subunit A [Actinomadura logoneensis]|uniref:ATP synthase subunit a n=1 Tax=Actinomadura logoneensis TaxID=2293572 RepID=A0A372JSZ3_9ACTN|nr:F0F1 ATP synthase subunit A [Actinomadura logoneensis]RFU43137.1 ATP synthase F0 subunit A [Actinomadura logoneensis]
MPTAPSPAIQPTTAPFPVSGGEFRAPGGELFRWGPLWPGVLPDWITKPVLLIVLSAVAVCVFSWRAFGRPALVPRGVQNIGEIGYLFVRDQIARPMIGADGDRWMPFLLPLFLFVLAMNLMGDVPVLQLPATSHFAMPLLLALLCYALYLGLSIRTQGLVGYFRNIMFPPGLPVWVYVFYAPIELLQHLVLRPFTQSVRLFANMFAGHILLAFFATVAWWFLLERPTVAGFGLGVVGVLMSVLLTAFEIFVQVLQAYIFTLLAASYIGGALHPDH